MTYTFRATFFEPIFREDDDRLQEYAIHHETRTFKTLSGAERVFEYWRNNEKQIVAMSISDSSDKPLRQFLRDNQYNITMDK